MLRFALATIVLCTTTQSFDANNWLQETWVPLKDGFISPGKMIGIEDHFGPYYSDSWVMCLNSDCVTTYEAADKVSAPFQAAAEDMSFTLLTSKWTNSGTHEASGFSFLVFLSLPTYQRTLLLGAFYLEWGVRTTFKNGQVVLNHFHDLLGLDKGKVVYSIIYCDKDAFSRLTNQIVQVLKPSPSFVLYISLSPFFAAPLFRRITFPPLFCFPFQAQALRYQSLWSV